MSATTPPSAQMELCATSPDTKTYTTPQSQKYSKTGCGRPIPTDLRSRLLERASALPSTGNVIVGRVFCSPPKASRKDSDSNAEAFTTPPKRTLTLIPATPAGKRKRKQLSRTGLFASDTTHLLPFSTPQRKDTRVLPAWLEGLPIGVGQTEDQLLLLEQPEGSKGCGAYALAMLLDTLSNSYEFTIDSDNFRTWLASCYLTNGEKVCHAGNRHANLKAIGLELVHAPIRGTREEKFEAINAYLTMVRGPIIISIAHKKLGGHWIVLDALDRIRDPNSGMAYTITREELSSNLEAQANETCIFIQSKTSE